MPDVPDTASIEHPSLEVNISGFQCWHLKDTNVSPATLQVPVFRSIVLPPTSSFHLCQIEIPSLGYSEANSGSGWLTSIAWVAVLATGSIFVGTIVQGLIILNHPDYVPHTWHGTLLCWAVIAVAVFINTVISGLLPMIEGLILVFHILGFFAVLVPLVYLSPHGSTASVFQTSLNQGGWPTQGLSYCVGFIGNVATFVGEFT